MRSRAAHVPRMWPFVRRSEGHNRHTCGAQGWPAPLLLDGDGDGDVAVVDRHPHPMSQRVISHTVKTAIRTQTVAPT